MLSINIQIKSKEKWWSYANRNL